MPTSAVSEGEKALIFLLVQNDGIHLIMPIFKALVDEFRSFLNRLPSRFKPWTSPLLFSLWLSGVNQVLIGQSQLSMMNPVIDGRYGDIDFLCIDHHFGRVFLLDIVQDFILGSLIKSTLSDNFSLADS